MDDIAYGLFMAILFGWLGCYVGSEEGQKQERQKWCEKNYTEKKAFDDCMDGEK